MCAAYSSIARLLSPTWSELGLGIGIGVRPTVGARVRLRVRARLRLRLSQQPTLGTYLMTTTWSGRYRGDKREI